MKYFIIHGAYGNPNENWFPWLKKELNGEVIIPTFPTPEGQTLNNWMKVFDYNYKDSIMIGHSIATAFILKLIEKKPVKAAFFVAGFASPLGNEFDSINKTFLEGFDFEKIRANCENFYVFYSDNDPYVSTDKAEELGKKLGVKPILVKGAGHFNETSGYIKFPLLLEKIQGVKWHS